MTAKAIISLALMILSTVVTAEEKQEKLYRCGNEYTYTVPKGQETNCKLISGGEPDPENLSLEPDFAKWVAVGRNSVGDAIYAARSPLQKEGNLLKGWTLWNYKKYQFEPDGVRYLSSMSLDIFDCAKRVSGSRQYVDYSLHSGEGKVTYTLSRASSEVKFSEAVPGSIGELLIDNACRKKKVGS